jgi:hypothetical protein
MTTGGGIKGGCRLLPLIEILRFAALAMTLRQAQGERIGFYFTTDSPSP